LKTSIFSKEEICFPQEEVNNSDKNRLPDLKIIALPFKHFLG